jgi:hypothetical protein
MLGVRVRLLVVLMMLLVPQVVRRVLRVVVVGVRMTVVLIMLLGVRVVLSCGELLVLVLVRHDVRWVCLVIE